MSVFLLPFSHANINSIASLCLLSIDSFCIQKPGTQKRNSLGDYFIHLNLVIITASSSPNIFVPCEQKCSIFWLLQNPLRSAILSIHICVCSRAYFPCILDSLYLRIQLCQYHSLCPIKKSSLFFSYFSFQIAYFKIFYLNILNIREGSSLWA